jgi:hypothetical protein
MEKLLLIVTLVCQPGRSPDRSKRQTSAQPSIYGFRGFGRAFLYAVLYLSAWLSRQLPAVLQQQTDIGFTGANRDWSILRQAKPATDEMACASTP